MTTELWVAAIAAALWCGAHILVVVRFADSQRLDAYPPLPREQTPLISVIIPARDEARNIEACLRSVLESDYGNLEAIVVDDHSSDGTGAIAQRVADDDAKKQGRVRARVIQAAVLPEGWFGKQWACQNGAEAARGEIFCFTDADTRHGPELLGRSAGAMRSRGADLFSVAGAQDALTFWEKVLQPFVFSILLSRFGGLEQMSRSTKPLDKIVNGQFLMLTRNTYAKIGGHAAVRDHVAEDLRLAQVMTERGMQVHTVLARDHMRTRMYTSLAEIRRGWGKNVFAGGRDTFPLGPLGLWVFRAVFPLPALVPVLPLVMFALGLLGILGDGALLFGAVAGGFSLLFYLAVYAFARVNPLWSLLYPLAAVMFSWICAEAAWRGSNVEWKGRGYVSRKAS